MDTFDLRKDTELSGFHASVDIVDVTRAGPMPDPDWLYVDTAGHAHRWAHDETIPSLTVVVDRRAWSDDTQEEYVAESHYECIWCQERIEPGMRSGDSYQRFAAVGPKRGSVEVKTTLIELTDRLRQTMERYDEIECLFTVATVRGYVVDMRWSIGPISYLEFTLALTGAPDAARIE